MKDACRRNRNVRFRATLFVVIKVKLSTPRELKVELPPHPPSDSPGGTELTFRPDVEGLRAIAVLVVVLYHAQVSWLKGGFIGVDVFFVISGFLITGLLVKEHGSRGKISLVGFYARRARRILPAAMIVIALTIVASYFVQNFITYGNVSSDGRWATLFAANFHFSNVGNDYFQIGAPKSPLQHFWSLAVEEQFYWVWPILVMALGLVARNFSFRNRILLVASLITLVSFVYSLVMTNSSPTWAYYSPLSRGWELGVGAILACLTPSLSRIPKKIGCWAAWTGLLGIGVASIIFSNATPYPGIAATLPVVATGVVIAGGMSGFGAIRFLGIRPMRSIGRVSYGWYLLHYPPMILLTGAVWHHPLSIEENLIIAAVTLVIANFMYFVIERPIRSSTTLAQSPLLSIGMGGAFVVVAFSICFLLHPSIHHLWLLPHLATNAKLGLLY